MKLPEGVVVNQPTSSGQRLLFMAGDGLWEQFTDGQTERLASMDEIVSLSEKANRIALDQIKTATPSSFTIGAYVTRKGQAVAAATYDRKLSTLWGLTAYARAYWNDVPVTINTRPSLEGEAGFEFKHEFKPKP